ncbi:hypothetical protein ASF27_16685 [Methylobacterium sp. Leaf102]|jgi:uncharacterized protein YecT (DUF1311 family)|uniref:lysozyme inhibitor LprI family protein n=1 Tax=unclassified Methylobacterium TaxID=2615210 RepID=UPI0006FA971C|nr:MULTISPECIES: lysozyme inhibitor LprI family protein [unclassified Methylobacterium]KQP18983.1 hypothetical protein ASF25_11320 [Methylobacterium sp. Leaf100]KQP32884.1 hypothetical protein ASF27_16685 [Methylobacterium sp. Leaf102]KQP70787.1 hypothetical protein ASF52_15440 [Methylobacterium sp. Leaf112]
MIRPAILLTGSFLWLGTAVLATGASEADLTDIPGTTAQCREAESRIACLQTLTERSARRLRQALAKARAAIARSPTISDAERPAARETLERTQRAWRIYARLRCEAEVPVAFTGGTGRNQAVLTCLRVHDARRTAELGDLAGID